jgi:hypothetical protein
VKAPQTQQPDLDHYIAIAEHAQKRAEQLEREALEVSRALLSGPDMN